MDSEHEPYISLPWEARREGAMMKVPPDNWKTRTYVMDAGGRVYIAGVFGKLSSGELDQPAVDQNANYIVKACNAYPRSADIETRLRLIVRAHAERRMADVEYHIKDAGELFSREMAMRLNGTTI